MHLSLYTDYSLRVITYLGVHSAGLVSIGQISAAFGISRNHLVKVVNNLATLGLVKTTRGRGGGLRLARNPASINLGELVRNTETGFRLVECFAPGSSTCRLVGVCQLKTIMAEARSAFFKALDGHTLADALRRTRQMAVLLGIPTGRTAAPLRRQTPAGHNGAPRSGSAR